MKKLFLLGFLMNLFVMGYSQSTGKAVGATCNCPAGWASCNAVCLFTDCCICFNPQTSEGGCACYWGFASCKSALIGADKFASTESSSDANISVSFDALNELFVWLASQKIDVSGFSRDCQTISSKYNGQKGKVPVAYADYNTIFNAYDSFLNGLNADQKALLRSYIDSKEKTR